MTDVVRTMLWNPGDGGDLEPLLSREWLVTNGLGGYATGTVGGPPTRRYHGLLIAALPAPLGRMNMLNHLSEMLKLPDGTVALLGGEERVPQLNVHGAPFLKEFRLELGLPVWRYEIGSFAVEKRLFMPYHQNTVHVVYRLVRGDETLRLKLLPGVHVRSHDAPVSDPLPPSFEFRSVDNRYELRANSDLPVLRMTTYGRRMAFTVEPKHLSQMLYRIEERRGYESVGDLWSPGYFRLDLAPGQEATLIASTEHWERVTAISSPDAFAAERNRRERLIVAADQAVQTGVGAELVLAADQFIIRPVTRVEDLALARAEGDDRRTVIAGYHWFTDWGRDTMISLEGLTLCTGRHVDAGYILRTFAHYAKDGLIPNMFPEGENDGLYHTADATLWFFHAVDRYLEHTDDQGTLKLILPLLIEIIARHVEGTRFHIGVDPTDGLLRQGQAGYQLTWMDAKLGDWVVTPRRGKAVEINALWYNAVRLLESWMRSFFGDQAAAPYAARAAQIQRSFNKRFWNPDAGFLYDVVDGENGNDPACRPNQLLAISLPHPVLDPSHWKPVLDVVERRLLTPVGLRSLAPGDPNYHPTYHGDLRTRDSAYHQGTVWAWLIGPLIDAWLKVYPDDVAGARKRLRGLQAHLDEACIGSVSEVFDAEPPYTARGCCAQAWSVAELLRAWVKTQAKSA